MNERLLGTRIGALLNEAADALPSTVALRLDRAREAALARLPHEPVVQAATEPMLLGRTPTLSLGMPSRLWRTLTVALPPLVSADLAKPPYPHRKGDLIEMLSFEFRGKKYGTPAIVCWAAPTRSNTLRIGVQFKGLSEAEKDEINYFILEESLELLEKASHGTGKEMVVRVVAMLIRLAQACEE